MENKFVVFLFPSTVFSGHEKMAIKILEKSPFKVSCILNEKLVSSFNSKNKFLSYHSFFSLIMILLRIRLTKNKVSIVLIAGSPYGFLFEKLIIKLFFFKLIDYVPVPELKVIEDKFHHKFMPVLNRMLIDKRLLIDDWQVNYSAVKRYTVIKNII